MHTLMLTSDRSLCIRHMSHHYCMRPYSDIAVHMRTQVDLYHVALRKGRQLER